MSANQICPVTIQKGSSLFREANCWNNSERKLFLLKHESCSTGPPPTPPVHPTCGNVKLAETAEQLQEGWAENKLITGLGTTLVHFTKPPLNSCQPLCPQIIPPWAVSCFTPLKKRDDQGGDPHPHPHRHCHGALNWTSHLQSNIRDV